ncbi:PIN domain-containing protein [Streptomyces sp. NPDC056165]|uniref:PIN domain-containing protein n=1 Tax=Streptomyces sp. NPDC056165 TaxID=3345733 RepID=UPI0035E1044C
MCRVNLYARSRPSRRPRHSGLYVHVARGGCPPDVRVDAVAKRMDDHKCAGRNPDIREAAKKADRSLKGLRANGDMRRGVRVVGDVHEHIEPKGDGLPKWLDLDVPDDRLVASTLLLQSRHPSSSVYVASDDINLQTKLAAVARRPGVRSGCSRPERVNAPQSAADGSPWCGRRENSGVTSSVEVID